MCKEKLTCFKQAFSLSEDTWVAIAKVVSHNRSGMQNLQQRKPLAYTVRRASIPGRRTGQTGSVQHGIARSL